jgi:hypothetical protein
MRYFKIKTAALAACIALTGCTVKKVKETGFLIDYSMLKTMPGQPETQYFESDCGAWKRYKKVIVEPVEIRFTDDAVAKTKNVEIPELQELADFFRNSLIEAVKDNYEVVTEPGPDVLWVKTAIVDVKPVDVVANVISKALFYIPVDLGEAAIEGELADSLTGERLSAIVDRKMGSMLSITGTYTTWGATKNAFEDWAEQLSGLLKQTLQQNTRAIESFQVQEIGPDKTEIKFKLSSLIDPPKEFTTQNPATISLDFNKTRNALSKKFHNVNQGMIKSFVSVEKDCKTRVVLRTEEFENYQIAIIDKTITIQINQ